MTIKEVAGAHDGDQTFHHIRTAGELNIYESGEYLLTHQRESAPFVLWGYKPYMVANNNGIMRFRTPLFISFESLDHANAWLETGTIH